MEKRTSMGGESSVARKRVEERSDEGRGWGALPNTQGRGRCRTVTSGQVSIVMRNATSRPSNNKYTVCLAGCSVYPVTVSSSDGEQVMS